MCIWIIIKIGFSKRFSVVDKKLMAHTFGGNPGSLPGLLQGYDFCFHPR
jgi:hypothetical protein